MTAILTYLYNYLLTYIITYLLTHLLTYLLTYPTEQSPSWEVNRFWGSREVSRILLKPKVHYRIHKCLPPVPIVSHIDRVRTPTSHFLNILILSSHLHLSLPSGLFLSGFPTKTLYTHLLFTCYISILSNSLFDHPHNIEWGVQIVQLWQE